MKTKKLLSLVLAFVFVASLAAIPAFAEGETEEVVAFNPGIVFEEAVDYTLIPTVDRIGDTTVTTAFDAVTAALAEGSIKLDLGAEKLFVPESVAIAAYSVDGGQKWKTASLGSNTGADISKLLNKENTIWLTTSYDKKAKGPTKGTAAVAQTADKEAVAAVEGAVVLKFAKIAARPKAEKLVVNYALFKDATGVTPGEWALTKKDATTTAVKTGLQVALSDDKKNPNVTKVEEVSFTWGAFPEEGGLNVEALAEGSKPTKRVYLVRLQPVMEAGKYAPASKPAKVTASSEQKAVKLKADYKKELIKGKENLNVFFGGDISKVDAEKTYTKDAPRGTLMAPMTKEQAKAGVDISTYMTEARESVTLWIGATEKKPATAKQVIKLAARAYLKNEALSPAKGKLKVDSKKYEVLNTEKNKWGSLPKVEASKTLSIRLKATAKGGKEDDTTYAASRNGGLVLGFGPFDEKKLDKKGIVSAMVNAPEYAGVLTAVPETESVSVEFGMTTQTVVFNVTGLVEDDTLVSEAGAGKISYDVSFGTADIVSATSSYADKKITLTLTTKNAGKTSVDIAFTVDAAVETADLYFPEMFSTLPANVTVTPKALKLPDVTAATIAALSATAVKYTFTFEDSLKALLTSGAVKITNNTLSNVSVSYDTATEGKIIASVVGSGNNETPQELVFTLAVDAAKTTNYVVAETAITKTVTITKVAALSEGE